jgi:hypothetical protein
MKADPAFVCLHRVEVGKNVQAGSLIHREV